MKKQVKSKCTKNSMTKTKMNKMFHSMVNKAFKLWASIGRAKSSNTCEYCGVHDGDIKSNGKPTVLNAHHIIIRDNHVLRFNHRNACILCQNCHKFSREGAHRGTIIFSEWFRNHRKDDYYYLIDNRNGPTFESYFDMKIIEGILSEESSLSVLKYILGIKND